MLKGSPGGLSTAGAIVFHQAVSGVPGVVEEYDQFGFAVYGAHLDGFSDPMSLLVGATGEDGGSLLGGPGVLHVFPSSSGGPLAAGQIVYQDTVDTTDDSARERFGYAITAGDFDHDGEEDILVAAPFESFDDPSVQQAGRVHLSYGSGGLLATDRGRGFDGRGPCWRIRPKTTTGWAGHWRSATSTTTALRTWCSRPRPRIGLSSATARTAASCTCTTQHPLEPSSWTTSSRGT